MGNLLKKYYTLLFDRYSKWELVAKRVPTMYRDPYTDEVEVVLIDEYKRYDKHLKKYEEKGVIAFKDIYRKFVD